jgi:phospholipid/cholesterol/gamma-HCH transport system permease protein
VTVLEQVGRFAIGYAEDAWGLTIQLDGASRTAPRVAGHRQMPPLAIRCAADVRHWGKPLPMTGIMSFCTGFILALQSALELRRFGALQFVVELVAIGFTRELGPLITALAVSGRSASAISAEIGTMVTVAKELETGEPH